MASVIFLAGDVRKIGAESYIHQHEGSSGVRGSTSEIAEEAAFMKKLEEKVTRIYTSRTNMTRTQFLGKIRKKDWFAEAEEALALGIATELA
jgi:ATP-dependent protease ClpP protease subunit